MVELSFVLPGSQGGVQGGGQGALRVPSETGRQEEMREAKEICGEAEGAGLVVNVRVGNIEAVFICAKKIK